MENEELNLMNEFKKYHEQLPDEALIEIIFFERGKLKKDARISAKEVLANREITNKEIDAIRKEIRKRKISERKEKLKEKDNGYGIHHYLLELIVDVFVSIFLL